RGRERRALDADVEVDDAVIVDVDLPVVIEVAVVPAARPQRGVEIDSTVVVDVDLSVERGVAGVGVHNQGVGGGDGASAEEGEAGLAGAGDAERGEAGRGGGHAGVQARAVPRSHPAAGVAAAGDHAGHARVLAAAE